MAQQMKFNQPMTNDGSQDRDPRRSLKIGAGVLAAGAIATGAMLAVNNEPSHTETVKTTAEMPNASGTTQELADHISHRKVGDKLTVVDVASLSVAKGATYYSVPSATGEKHATEDMQVLNPELVHNTEDDKDYLCINVGGTETGCIDLTDSESTSKIQIDTSSSDTPEVSAFDPQNFPTREAIVSFVDDGNGQAFETDPTNPRAGENGHVPLAQAFTPDVVITDPALS